VVGGGGGGGGGSLEIITPQRRVQTKTLDHHTMKVLHFLNSGVRKTELGLRVW
jgi:hypothetical protein